MSLGLAESLSKLVKTKYNAAKSAGALTFASTELAIVRIQGIPFQLRYCPALAKKPTSQNDSNDQPKKKIDPFENPTSDLHIADVPAGNPSHILVLNKFPIIQNHFIIATKQHKPQTHLLDEGDLARAFQCLTEWGPGTSRNRAPRLFAFFNSGEHSGASQPHRHIQLLPVEDIAEGDINSEWRLLVDNIMSKAEPARADSGMVAHPDLPFLHYGVSLPPDPTPNSLLRHYTNLYQASAEAVRNYISAGGDDLELHSTENGDLPISYNLAMTTESMVICPRRTEGELVKRDDGSEVDLAALNGTVLGGTLMVKNEEAWHLLQSDPSRLASLLAAVGIPATSRSNGPGVNL